MRRGQRGFGKIAALARSFRASPEAFAASIEKVFDEGGFGVALQSEDGIIDARATLLAMVHEAQRIRYCLEIIASAQLKKGTTLPDW